LNEIITVLIVDDSAFMRKSLSIMLESDPGIKVIATARNGREGVDFAKSLHPDIITLDIEMPIMDGITALQKIMKECPTSVIMVSSITTEGAQATIQALELGAVDFISKELSFVSLSISNIKAEIIQKVKTIVRQKSLKERLARIRDSSGQPKTYRRLTSVLQELPRIGYSAVAIGISTGGPLTLQKILPMISDKINVPVFIVQHMPPKFTRSLAERLNGLSPLEIKEAEDNEEVRRNVVYIAPGGSQMTITNESLTKIKILISSEPSDIIHRPSVDVMMNSVIDIYGRHTLGIIMTGMGRDGLEATKKLKSIGGHAIAQDEESSVVYGMPKAIVDAGYADLILPPEGIAGTINRVFQ